MPAIPVYAVLEMHLTDEELRALTDLAHDLVQIHARFLEALPTAQDCSAVAARLNAACALYAATTRTMRERNLTT
ncbi:hypothetical protein ACOTDN_25970 [Achromobacter xylosoxidans]